MSAVKVSDPSHGTLTLNSDGSFTYTPTAGYHGPDSFTYKANDGFQDSNTATVTITVDAPPTVTSTTPADTATHVAVGSPITITFDKQVTAASGAFTLECPTGTAKSFTTSSSPATTYTLTPSANLPTNTTCTVKVLASKITDSFGINQASDYTFSFTTITPPIAVNDSYSATGNVSISVPAANGVTTNDTLNSGTVSAFDATSTHGGNVNMTTSGPNIGAFTYDPPAGYTGTDTFTYTLTNGDGSSTATVSITISDMIWFVDNS